MKRHLAAKVTYCTYKYMVLWNGNELLTYQSQWEQSYAGVMQFGTHVSLSLWWTLHEHYEEYDRIYPIKMWGINRMYVWMHGCTFFLSWFKIRPLLFNISNSPFLLPCLFTGVVTLVFQGVFVSHLVLAKLLFMLRLYKGISQGRCCWFKLIWDL